MTSFACVFPGQGSQSIGMLADLQSEPLVRACFQEASSSLGYDLWRLIQEGPVDQLNQTEYTQVAMLTADVAIFKTLKAKGFNKAHFLAGHSLGEYAALVCADALSLREAVLLVERRGQLMQQHVPLGTGAMAAIIGLDNTQVEAICQQASDSVIQVSPANYNAIGQVVIAGHHDAVLEAIRLSNEAGARMSTLIPVSVPCHCALLKEASEAFALELAKANVQVPNLPVISNVDLSIYNSPEQIRTLLQKQLYSPVRWVETIQFLQEKGVKKIVECGPGRVLSGLIKRIDRSITVMSVYDAASLEQTAAEIFSKESC